MKKLIACILCFVSVFSAASATYIQKRAFESNLSTCAYMINEETGEKITLQPITQFVSPMALSETVQEATVSVAVPAPRIGGSQTSSSYDDGVVYEGTLKIEFDRRSTGAEVDAYKINKVSGNWRQINDRASISDRYVQCSQQTVGDLGSGEGEYIEWLPTTDSFSYNTNFTHYMQDHAIAAICGASSSVTIHFRGQTWKFVVQCNIIDTPPE